MQLHGTRTPKSDSIPSDETLVKEYLSGNRDAFATLYGRYFDRVTGYVVNRTRSRPEYVADREDLVQEIFTEALRLLPTFRASDYDTSDAFRRWLYHIPAGNVLYQYFRRYWCTRQAHARSVDDFASHLREEARQASTSAAPAIELPQEIRDALEALPSDQRRAIELHHLEGLTIPQTARVMRRTEGQTNGLIFRGRRTLRNPNPDPKPPTPVAQSRRAPYGQVRLALLNAARELLTEKGTFTGAEVAARVGRNSTIVFHYFGSMDNLRNEAAGQSAVAA